MAEGAEYFKEYLLGFSLSLSWTLSLFLFFLLGCLFPCLAFWVIFIFWILVLDSTSPGSGILSPKDSSSVMESSSLWVFIGVIPAAVLACGSVGIISQVVSQIWPTKFPQGSSCECWPSLYLALGDCVKAPRCVLVSTRRLSAPWMPCWSDSSFFSSVS